MCVLQVIPKILNDPNRKTIKSPKIFCAKKTFAKKVRMVRKVQLSPPHKALYLASRQQWNSGSGSASSSERACPNPWHAKRSSVRDGWRHELRESGRARR